MRRANRWFGIALVLLIAVPRCAQAQRSKADSAVAPEQVGVAAPSVKKGDPPPGNAMSPSVSQARAMLKEAINKRYIGRMEACERYLLRKMCGVIVPSAATDVRVRTWGVAFAAPYSWTSGEHEDGKFSVRFGKDQDYIQAYRFGGHRGQTDWTPSQLYNVGYLPDLETNPMAYAILQWSDEATAQRFADAFNRLLYAAYHDEDFLSFATAAKAWRANPAKPPLSPEADRHRLLAENAIREQDLDSAVEHYESALEIQPMWPAGWFNLAVIYAEQKNYADASDCMKHYLELVPDAPDAKDARDQMIIWEDRARH